MLSPEIKISHDEARLLMTVVPDHFNACGATYNPAECQLAQGLVDRLEATIEYIADIASEAAADMAGEIEPDDAE